MTLTPEQKAEGWIEWNGGERPIKDSRTRAIVMLADGDTFGVGSGSSVDWSKRSYLTLHKRDIIAYRIIEAHGADAEPARPTPYPNGYDELVWDADGWSQTIIVDGKRPEWLRDDDWCIAGVQWNQFAGMDWGRELAIRVRRREPKRETVTGLLSCQGNFWRVSYDLIDGTPDLSTLKIAEDAL